MSNEKKNYSKITKKENIEESAKEVETKVSEVTPKAEKPKKSFAAIVWGCTNLNMREKPDITSTVIRTVSSGTAVTVVEEKSGWYKYKVDGITGWSMKDYIK